MKILKFFVFVMIVQMLVPSATGSGKEGFEEDPRSKRKRAVSDPGPGGSASSATGEPEDGDIKRNKKRHERPGFMTQFPTMKGVPLRIEAMFLEFSIGTNDEK